MKLEFSACKVDTYTDIQNHSSDSLGLPMELFLPILFILCSSFLTLPCVPLLRDFTLGQLLNFLFKRIFPIRLHIGKTAS